MRAITYSKFGPASEVLVLEHIPTPDPKPGEVLVRIHSSGVNPSDIRARAGGRPGVVKPPFPKIIPHSDGSGIIESVGDGVSRNRIGERVWIWNGQWQRAFGTAAEFITLPQQQAIKLPESTSMEVGAVLGIPALTAMRAIQTAGSVKGKLVLISGGSGTVGRLAVQIAKSAGASVIATAGSKTGLESALSAGADSVFDYNSDNLADQILTASDGKMVDLIVEVEFGRNVETNTRIIKNQGKIVTYGSAKSMTPQLPFYPLLFKAVTIEMVLVYILNVRDRSTTISQLTRLLESDALNFQIFKTMDLEDCAKAHEIVESGQRSGSVILTID